MDRIELKAKEIENKTFREEVVRIFSKRKLPKITDGLKIPPLPRQTLTIEVEHISNRELISKKLIDFLELYRAKSNH